LVDDAAWLNGLINIASFESIQWFFPLFFGCLIFT
jgi:hypothetical protein